MNSSNPMQLQPLAKVFASCGLVFFLLSLALPCVDTDFAEAVRGEEVRGYMCWLGCFLAPLVSWQATPLWIVLSVGNVGIVVFPAMLGSGKLAQRIHTFVRVAMPLGAIGAIVLGLYGKGFGVSQLYWGATLWFLTFVLLSIAAWLPRVPKT